MKDRKQLNLLLPISPKVKSPPVSGTQIETKSEFLKKHRQVRASLREKGLVIKQA